MLVRALWDRSGVCMALLLLLLVLVLTPVVMLVTHQQQQCLQVCVLYGYHTLMLITTLVYHVCFLRDRRLYQQGHHHYCLWHLAVSVDGLHSMKVCKVVVAVVLVQVCCVVVMTDAFGQRASISALSDDD
jgi:hypothetical protein